MSVDLRDRLRRALGPTREARPTIAPAAGPVRARPGRDVAELLPGRVHADGERGACFVAERSFELDHLHGGERLGAFLDLTERGLACLARDAGQVSVDPRTVVFLDTETTGLSGGTGTYVFMVGLGFFDVDRFVVRQYFMRHHAEEAPMLAALNQLFPRFAGIVSFNGKAFDLPLLQTRFITGRQRPTLRSDPHLDLLFPARRFWRDRLPSCSLGTIEQAILGHARRGDVPSWMIPQLYFRYVRDGDARPIVPVFRHNLDDVLSLVALACRLGRLLGDPLGPANERADAEDLGAVGRLYEDLGLADEAVACYERALIVGSGPARQRVAVRLALLCKRIGRSQRALELWRRLAASGLVTCGAHVELAKHYEHHTRDYAAAIVVVQEALALLELAETRRRSAAAAERAELERRLGRLLDKQRRRTPSLSFPS